VKANSITSGDAFASTGTAKAQTRLLVVAGILF
jgi:hypothetical protein